MTNYYLFVEIRQKRSNILECLLFVEIVHGYYVDGTRGAHYLRCMKATDEQKENKPREIAMSRVQRMDLVPSLNALTLVLVAVSTAFYTLVLGL